MEIYKQKYESEEIISKGKRPRKAQVKVFMGQHEARVLGGGNAIGVNTNQCRERIEMNSKI